MKENSKRCYLWGLHRKRRLLSIAACLVVALLLSALRRPFLRRAAAWRTLRTTLRTRDLANSAPLRDYVSLSSEYMPKGDVQAAAIDSMRKYRDQINSQPGASAGAAKKKRLLCVTFVMNDEETLERVSSELIVPTTRAGLSVRCDSWLLASYCGPDDVLEAFAKRESKGSGVRVEVIKNGGGATRMSILKDLVSELKINNEVFSQRYNDLLLPKTLLLCKVLDSIRDYERVWLLDNDLSLKAFDMDRFFRAVDNAFGSIGGVGARVPLLMQPLVAGSTQTYPFLNHDAWRNSNATDLLAVGSHFIEMQLPIIDAAFLQWFINHVVKPAGASAHILGADWGLDSLFCSAAGLFAYDRPGLEPCAIVVDGDPVEHLDLKTMDGALGYGPKYALNKHFMRLLREAFPRFFFFGNDKRAANPLLLDGVTRYYKLSGKSND